MNEPRSAEDWGDLYEDLRPTYDAFTERLAGLLEALLADEDLPYSWTDTYAVTAAGLEDAIDEARRRGRVVADPFLDLANLVGVTVATYSLEHVARISEVVERELEAVHDASTTFEDARAAEPDRDAALTALVYPYARYVVRLAEPRASLPEWAAFAGLHVQVDVQTLFQWAWERGTGYLVFDSPSSFAPDVRDALVRAVGHLAAADRDFVEVDRVASRLYRRYDDAIAGGDLEIDIDGTALWAYLAASDTVAQLIEIGEDVGLAIEEERKPAPPWTIEQRLIWLCRRYRIDTIRALDDTLREADDRTRQILEKIGHVSSERGFRPWALDESVVTWLILVLKRADAETVALANFNDEITYALNTLIGNPVGRES